KVAGLGFAGVPDVAELDRIERAFAAHQAPVRIELAHLADPAVGALLTRRDYRLTAFENVLGRVPDGTPERVAAPGIEVRPSGDDEFDAWLDVVMEGFARPDAQGAAGPEEPPSAAVVRAVRDLAAVPGVTRYAALHRGVLVGGASLRTADRVA